MGVRIITTWPALFGYAHAEGQARLAAQAQPSEENLKKLAEAEKEHADYKQLCLEADDMIGLPDVSDIMSGRPATA